MDLCGEEDGHSRIFLTLKYRRIENGRRNRRNRRKKEAGFLEGKGGFSMRRLLALIFGIAGIAAGVFALVLNYMAFMKKGATPDKSVLIILVSFGVPGLISSLFMFFTSWESVATVVEAVKK